MSTMTDFAADFAPGSVWLVGAGPGHAGLLTLQAHAALQAADIIVYDALVGDDILALAPEETPREYAGKRGGKPSPKQADISLRLIQLARQGKRVLRLKGGDPFVFGRGGEEALTLVQAGVPFRICPGITAGIGGLAFAGIPLTHRDTNHAITMITGHDATGNVTGVDWDAVAKGSPALVLYMAIKHIGAISEKLIAAGRPASEPVAVVTNASLPEMSVLETSLGNAATDIERHNVKPPAIVAIGEIVRLRSGLDWLGAASGKVLEPDPLSLGRDDSEQTG
ncbi:uroporphyrinogen-III C-methyltransferase [Nisaea acidiphila]|uniref:uroporphyrinogen-III C-methyltransferase n=1 Tax=Nisaea acidiphila TaxID=1862145 RepID=A0A9J7AMF9_9PROT|nr:uroporphyrinogen-III C-methyltransferase [Nisaea acidiphila]UUX48342.1 uroporphyrinogen-III C-methyltransferase [Nisaea acidiphila]